MAQVPGQIFDFTVTDSSLGGLLQKINSFTDVGQGGILGIFTMIVVGFGLFLMMRDRGNERALPVSLLVTSIIGLLLRLAGFIGDNVFWISIGLFIISIIMLIREQGQFE